MKSILCLLGAAVAAAAEKPPHVIFMLVDDLGWNDVGWHDQFGQVQTPKLDALVADSIKLSQYYVYRFCSPSRSTFQTGRYPWHVGQHTHMNLNPTPGIACGINLEYDFMPKVLKQKGYATWALGKWHLGFLSNNYTPTYRGFDHYLGYYSGAEEHFTHEKSGAWKGAQYYDLANNTGTHVAPCLGAVGNASATYSSYLYGNETLRLLAGHDPAVPLYVYLAWNNVHDPNEAPDNYIAKHKNVSNTGRRNLGAMMSAIDDQLTDVVAALKAKDMWKDTVLIFSTDNGGNLGGSGINYPLRGGKYTFWQGGVRGVSFVGGGRIPDSRRGTTWDGYVHAADWYTTIAGLAGASTDKTGPLPPDGVDVWDALVSGSASPRDEVVIQVITDHAGNAFDLPGADYCELNAPERPHCDGFGGTPARPYPYATDCTGAADQVWQVNSTFDGSVCQSGLCFNVQRSETDMILYAPQPGNSNEVFHITGGLMRGELRGQCVLAAAKGEQLTYGDCSAAAGWKWSADAGALQLSHANGTHLCIAAHAAPAPPPGPAQLQEGALIQGKWKLLYGYPGWRADWDGWIQPPAEGAQKSGGSGAEQPCAASPCLFDIVADPTEHSDVAAQYPAVVANMTARLRELAKGEVTVAESGLCPTQYGSKADPRCRDAAAAVGFWVPWL